MERVVLMGVFSAIIGSRLDRACIHASQMGLPCLFKHWLNGNELVNIWQYGNKKLRDYTFYSGRHGSHSRINYSFLSGNITKGLEWANIGLQANADHAPVVAEWVWKAGRGNKTNW